DWSSVVCSSDLHQTPTHDEQGPTNNRTHPRRGQPTTGEERPPCQHHHVIAAGRSQERAGRPEGTVPPWLTAHGADRRGRARAPAAPDGCAAPARRVHPPPPRL